MIKRTSFRFFLTETLINLLKVLLCESMGNSSYRA